MAKQPDYEQTQGQAKREEASDGNGAAERRRSRRAEADDPGTAAPKASIAAPAAPVAPVAPAIPGQGTSVEGASPQMVGYDAYTQAAMGKSPAEAMQMAQAAAAQTAQMQSDQAIRASAKGARTAGAMPGQAALAATGVGADAYGQGLAQGQQQYYDLSKFGATLGSEMSGRLARNEQTQAGLTAAKMQADAQKAGQKSQEKQGLIGNIIGAVGGIASLFSDERLKEDVEPADFSDALDKISSYTFKYKGKPRDEAGVMAQDLEGTEMEPAVLDTPEGKMLDTRRLSSMNTAALGEHEKRLKSIEAMLKHIGGINA
jgi:hypothetical protein